MATMTTTAARFAPAPAPAPILALYNRIIATFERNTLRATIRRELSNMSDRELADLGLSYSDIEDVASGNYRRG